MPPAYIDLDSVVSPAGFSPATRALEVRRSMIELRGGEEKDEGRSMKDENGINLYESDAAIRCFIPHPSSLNKMAAQTGFAPATFR